MANINQLATDCRKQVEAVVTPQQLEAYKKAVFPGLAFELLAIAQRRVVRPSASPAGRRRTCSRFSRSYLNGLLRKKWSGWSRRRTQSWPLSPQQCEKLRSDVQR